MISPCSISLQLTEVLFSSIFLITVVAIRFFNKMALRDTVATHEKIKTRQMVIVIE